MQSATQQELAIGWGEEWGWRDVRPAEPIHYNSGRPQQQRLAIHPANAASRQDAPKPPLWTLTNSLRGRS